jgi:hypothetical protein
MVGDEVVSLQQSACRWWAAVALANLQEELKAES